MEKLVLAPQEVLSIEALTGGIAARFDSCEDPAFLAEAAVLAHELPRRVRAALLHFKLHEPEPPILILSGFPVDQARCGPTPGHWQLPAGTRSPTLEQEIQFVLASALLGECIGWRTEQAGRIVHNVMPVRGMENQQIGIGCEQEIWWHTEDASHPFQGDYIGLFCLRNLDRVPTTFASLGSLALEPELWRPLFEPHFVILPDLAHGHQAADAGDNLAAAPLNGAASGKGHDGPVKRAVLSGDPRSPYIRIDPYFMPPAADARAQLAVERLTKAIDARLQDVVLEAGEMCFLDNLRCVHGRRSFKARYDGQDRWLKRLNITRDLRKSRALRGSAESRILA